MEFYIHPQGWGFCLFALNVSPEVLSYYDNPEDPNVNLFDSLIQAIGPCNFVRSYSLFGIQDLICVFKRSPDQPNEEERHSVIEKIADWSGHLSKLKELPDIQTPLK